MTRARFGRLDRLALGLIFGLLAVIAFMLIRGDQVGVRVSAVSPAPGSAAASTRPRIALTFSEPMIASEVESRLSVSPAISGTWRWSGATAHFDLAAPLTPDTTYSVTLGAGATSRRGRDVQHSQTWQFTTRRPRVAFLSPASGVPDLFVSDAAGGAPIRLTTEPLGVFDYAVSPDGDKIAYSATRDKDGARDVFVMNADGSGRERIANCDGQACQYVSWSADGTRLAFERRNLIQGAIGKTPGPARIWLYDLPSKQSVPLLSDEQQIGSLPRWAPAGDQIAFYDPAQSAIVVLDTKTGEHLDLTSLLGDPGTWSPDATQLAYVELTAADDGQFSQILRADLARKEITPLMTLTNTNDSSVAWSPLGDLIAFGRQASDAPTAPGTFAPIGPQVFVVGADGQRARQLTHEPDHSYSALAWSPDQRWIAANRINLTAPDPKPEVWLVASDGARAFRLASDATLPAWLP